MQFPTPDNLDHIPVWRNYVCGQVGQACLGALSPRIAAVGVTERGTAITLHFRVDKPVADDYPEINVIIEDFDDLTGNILELQIDIQEWDADADPREVDWTYRRRREDVDHSYLEEFDVRDDYRAGLEARRRGRTG